MIRIAMVVVEFPGSYRDLSALKAQGLNYSTTSDEAVKLYDALLHQSIYDYENPVLGGRGGTKRKMLAADPSFAMGNIMTLGLACMGTNPDQDTMSRRKLAALDNRGAGLHNVYCSVMARLECNVIIYTLRITLWCLFSLT